jgi:hypothetical protein
VQTYLPGSGGIDVLGTGPGLVVPLTDPSGTIAQGTSVESGATLSTGFIKIPGMSNVALGVVFDGPVTNMTCTVDFFVGEGTWPVDTQSFAVTDGSPSVQSFQPTSTFDTIQVSLTNNNPTLSDPDVVLEALSLTASTVATAASVGPPSPSPSSMPRVTFSGSYLLTRSDIGCLVEFIGAGATTITIPSASVLGENFWCILKHSGTGTTGAAQTLTINGTLDGVATSAVYPGDTRIIQSDSIETTSTLLAGGRLILTFSDSPYNYVIPTATKWHGVDLWGGGGGGGAGFIVAAGTACSGGGGGGGGGRRTSQFAKTALGTPGSTIACAIGAGGAGGAVSGAAGAQGGTSNFGTLLYAYGGGGGADGGASRSAAGGGGAGLGGSGSSAVGAGSGAGGIPFGPGGGPGGAAGGSERVSGGGGGGTASGAIGQAGGNSGNSGGGGGSGGGISIGSGTFNGGGTNSPVVATTLGTGGGVAPGGAGTAPPAWADGAPASQGGPGGASATVANGGAGAAGQTPAAGGGGGGSTQTGFLAGPGGNGGDGRLTILYG